MNAGVLIRSIGERTEQCCYEVVKRQFDGDVQIMRNVYPLYESVRMFAEKAEEMAVDWLVVVDADELPVRGAIKHLLKNAQKKGAFWTQGRTRCKFLGVMTGGIYVYKSSLLRQSNEFVDNVIRPESVVRDKMKTLGHYSLKLRDVVVSYHAYEQYYRDICRVAYVRGVKMAKSKNKLLPKWINRSHEDYDYRVASDAYSAGLKHTGRLEIDGRIQYGDIRVPEKEPLQFDSNYFQSTWIKRLNGK